MAEDYDELYDLLIKFTDENIKEVIHWVICYKNERRNLVYISPEKVEALKDDLLNLRKKLEQYCDYEIVSEFYHSRIEPLLNETYRDKLNIALSKDSKLELIVEINKVLSQNIKDVIQQANSYDQDQETYLKDSEQLIQDIIEILRNEYQKRILETKLALTKYTEPHKNALLHLRLDIEAVEKALQKLETDTLLSENDRVQIRKTLVEKKNEMIFIMKREEENIKDTKAFIQEIKSAQNRFHKMILMLEKKNLEASNRKGYLSLINRLNAGIPMLDNLFHDLSNDLKNDMTSIRTAFYLLNMSVKDDLIKSLENQSIISNILGIPGKSILSKIKENRDTLEKLSESNDVYDIDLSFLNTEK